MIEKDVVIESGIRNPIMYFSNLNRPLVALGAPYVKHYQVMILHVIGYGHGSRRMQ